MHKLPPVEQAKTLFNEARDWGVWRWLTEKKRARQTADAAWEALDEYEKKVKAGWSPSVKEAYRHAGAGGVDPELKSAVQHLKEADKEAYKARMDAEAHFDEADRRMSAGMACEGAQMALDAWELREKYVRKMEALGKKF
jgi:hypothetical protein